MTWLDWLAVWFFGSVGVGCFMGLTRLALEEKTK